MVQLEAAVNHGHNHFGITHGVIVPNRLAIHVKTGMTGIVLAPHLVPVGVVECNPLPHDPVGLYSKDPRHGFKDFLGIR